MPCQIPYRDDSAQLLLFKIASCLAEGGGGGVLSFNSRTGAVTLLASDVTPLVDDIYVNETGDSMSGLLDITTASTSFQAITEDAGAANTPETIQIYHRTSAVPLTGFGNRLQFYADTDGGSDQIQTRIDSQWVDATDATRSSRLVFGTRNTGGVISSPLILTNGQLQLLDGLATIPSLSFQNDTDTGIYRVGANNLGISVGGVKVFEVFSAGARVESAANSTDAFGVFPLGSGNPVFNVDTVNRRVGIGLGFAPSYVMDVAYSDSTAYSAASIVPQGIRITNLDTTAQSNVSFYFTNGSSGTATSAITGIRTAATVSALTFRTSDGTGVSEQLRLTTTDFLLATGVRLAIASGANQRAGDAVLVGGTVTVANTTVTANTRVYLTRRVTGGTIGFAVTYTIIAATSFTITSDNVLDTSTYSYLLIEVP